MEESLNDSRKIKKQSDEKEGEEIEAKYLEHQLVLRISFVLCLGNWAATRKTRKKGRLLT